MCLVQAWSLYNVYLHVYAFIILTSTCTYIKTTACGHNQFLLLQAEQKTFTSLILPDIPGQLQPAIPTLQEYIRMAC